jgi:hypothetical protein
MYEYPVYAYRYRLTVNFELDGKVHSGSSLIEIGWQEGIKLGDSGGFAPMIRGQAPVVDLEDRGVVIATLIAEDWGWHNSNAGWGTLWLVPSVTRGGGDPAMLPTLRGKRKLAFDNLPRFLWFSNPKNPTTAKTLLVDDIPSVFGPSARFASAFVEITNDPIVIDIRQKLPWIKALEERARGEGVLYLPNKLGISRYMFIGDAS